MAYIKNIAPEQVLLLAQQVGAQPRILLDERHDPGEVDAGIDRGFAQAQRRGRHGRQGLDLADDPLLDGGPHLVAARVRPRFPGVSR